MRAAPCGRNRCDGRARAHISAGCHAGPPVERLADYVHLARLTFPVELQEMLSRFAREGRVMERGGSGVDGLRLPQ